MNNTRELLEFAEDKGVELLGFMKGIVLCRTSSGYHPYVTWEYNGSFFTGHYFSTLTEAEEDFKERI